MSCPTCAILRRERDEAVERVRQLELSTIRRLSRAEALAKNARAAEVARDIVSLRRRNTALRWIADMLVRAADEAPNRDSEERLRDAAARVFDAMHYEGGP